MFDSHCHLDDFEDYSEVIQRAKAEGVTEMLTCGTGVESSRKLVEIADKNEGVYVAVGLGYEFSNYHLAFDIEFTNLVKRKNVVAVGECGLDNGEDLELFRRHIQLAQEAQLPLAVHCRNSFEQIYDEVRHIGQIGLIHCFTGNEEWMRKFVDLGWYISFGGIVTFKKSEELRDVLRKTPQERILVETDAPYLAPEPIRGSRNEPMNVKIVCEMIARERNQSWEEVAKYTRENAKRLLMI